MKVQKIHHVSMVVKDLEKARKLYSELFGIEFEGPFEQPEVDVKFLRSAVGLNIAAPLTSDGPTAKALEKRGEGLSALIFSVPNMDEAVADLATHGVRIVAKSDSPATRSVSLHPKDLHGVMVELMEE